MPTARTLTTTDPFGDMIFRARHRHGKTNVITQEQVAKALGVVQSTISAWESGRARPSLPDLKKLAEFLNIDVLDLVNAASSSVPVQ